MATIAENKAYYDNYDWRYTGEQWASRWGGSDIQWYGTILPRIQLFLPAATIVEIGCGHGRLSRFLEPYCERLILIDMTESCVNGCARLFKTNPRVTCVLGDGISLGSVDDASIDLVFSFFSLVHADVITLRCYLLDISRKLRANGVAFIHHSNAGACVSGDPSEDAVLHDYRDASVSADMVAELARAAGLACRSQELFGWETDQLLTDCFSVVVRPGSRWAKANTVIPNWDFSFEVEKLGQLAEIYGAHGYAR
jgi:SAM-dependent methyltransferase